MRTPTTTLAPRSPTGRRLLAVAVSILAWAASSVVAAATDLAGVPLFTSSNTAVKPNLMFVLDDSGSMENDYLPDAANSATTPVTKLSSQCNGLAYNPSVTYQRPADSDGKDLLVGSLPSLSTFTSNTVRTPDSASVTVASSGSVSLTFSSSSDNWFSTGDAVVIYENGTKSTWVVGTVTSWSGNNKSRTLQVKLSFSNGSGTLSSNLRVLKGTPSALYYRYVGGSEQPLAYTYNTNGNVITSTTFYNECNGQSGSQYFVPVLVTAASAEADNYGNWYTYHRTRMLTMKTGVSQAFKNLDARYRVGFTTINTTTASGNVFLDIEDFNATHKSLFYTRLNSQKGSDYTPLRGALSRAGQYFANKAPGQTKDPMQYACQRNFTLLSSDGYWNDKNGTPLPKQLDGSTDIGQQDGDQPAPFNDGTTTSTVYQATITVSGKTKTSVAQIMVNGVNILSGDTSESSDSGTVAKNIVSKLSLGGYSATRSGSVVTVIGPANAAGHAPVVTLKSGSMSFTTTAFAAQQVTTTTGPSNTLADVAMYYYKTDLRDAALQNAKSEKGTDVAANDKITGTPADPATHQHMKTFTLGLGIDGLLGYTEDYDQGTSTDFNAIKNGTLDWPTPSNNNIRNVDDLWHAAVNGRGKYFSAKDSNSLVKSLNDALTSIKKVVGTASAAATSTLQPVQGDNKIFVAQFTSAEWTGDLNTYTIDPATGAFSSNPLWSAKTQLNAAVNADATSSVTSRNIYYANGTTLRAFTLTNLTADGLAGHVTDFCNKAGAGAAAAPAQCSDPGFDTTSANDGSNLVAYLRGRALNTLYRTRASVLGDVINASPVHLRKPSFLYTENSYSAFKTTHAARDGTVFVAANDGMLHAFDADTGDERWAFIPTLMLPKLYRLADSAYPNHHEYFVDATPTVGDIYVPGDGWKTILVGGFNGGGRGYYALDVTDPVQPKVLWEFTDNNLGYSFGNPIITKRANGTWVVVFASGYNNVSPGDGEGRIFVLNANTGALQTTISTGEGSTATPSGLAKLNAWVDSPIDNTAKRFYGGDLLGNLWRIDVDSLVQPYASALKLANFQVTGVVDPQPITIRPLLGLLDANGAKRTVIFVATGRYLGTTDLVNTDAQTIYAIKDDLSATGHGDVRSGGKLVAQTLTTNSAVRTITTTNPVNWATKAGWMLDLPSAGERVNVEMRMEFNILTVASNLPSNDPCAVGGSSWLYRLDIATGGTVPGASSVGEFLADAQTVGLTSVQLTTGDSMTIVVDSSGKLTGKKASPPPVVGPPRRTSWRELVN